MKIGCGVMIEREGFLGDNDCGEMCRFCKEVHYCTPCLEELAYQEARLCMKAQGFLKTTHNQNCTNKEKKNV